MPDAIVKPTDPCRALVLLPDEVPDPDGFLDAMGLRGAAVHRLVAGEVRPFFEPHPDLCDRLQRGDLLDIVVVTATTLRRFGGQGREHVTAAFLEQQLLRLEAYRAHPGLRLGRHVRLHAWLWDRARGRVVPLCPVRRELLRENAVELSLAASPPHSSLDQAS